MGTIAEDPDAELRALRERAYGPQPDLDDAALARLRALEDERRRALGAQLAAGSETAQPAAPSESSQLDPSLFAPRLPEVPAASAAAAFAPVFARTDAETPDAPRAAGDPGTAGDPGPADDPGAATDPRAAGSPTAAPARWWRLPVAVPLVAGAALVAAGAAFGIAGGISFADRASHPGQVAVLDRDTETEWPDNFYSGDDGRLFGEFAGLRPMIVANSFPASSDGTCLYVFSDLQSINILGAGCTAGEFAARTAIEVTEDSPQALKDRFPVGTSLMFEVDGDRVRVYAADPPPTPPA
ncbi:hypothetical protein N3K63_04750 [Microbacterium sp. W1N]|uniref:hypothetical protein n=1 Tax=Microbacterium festucae TaxID=2977531 RepID=UPI0021BFDF5F|nr:hypothetical protein [Microbacterium festucae]MCT9819592.1 hypothetical protein [Microbacterium festucae]